MKTVTLASPAVATSAAVRGSDIAGVATILGVERPNDVADAVMALDDAWVAPVRAGFVSLGTCSIDADESFT